MKRPFVEDFFLRWAVCVGSYGITAVLFPYNFYLQEQFLPVLSHPKLLAFAGTVFLLGTGLHLELLITHLLGKRVGMTRNLPYYFGGNFAFALLYVWGTDNLCPFVNAEPFWLYLLLAAPPAILISILYSFRRSRP